MAEAVGWNLADGPGSRVVGGGPRLAPEVSNPVVAQLYHLAGRWHGWCRIRLN